MATLWIVHRDERARGALARLSAAGSDALLGEPSDRAFETTTAPRIVLLGLENDLEAELEFAHRHAARIPDARWILLPKPGDEEEAARLFDTLSAEILVFPPPPDRLRRRIRRVLAARSVETLSARRVRDALSSRFSRFFADLELPQLLRALDPRLLAVPLLVRGERGSGRSLLARYVHTFGGGSPSDFIRVPCQAVGSTATFRETLRDAVERGAERGPSTLCLENLNRLPLLLQSELRDWIEFAAPPAFSGARRTRWIATLGDGPEAEIAPDLDPGLAQSLAGIGIRIPPLRERPLAIGAFAADTALEWCSAHGERPRGFSPGAIDALREYPWPGNLRELEAVVSRTLAAGLSDPIEAEQIRFDPAEEVAESGAWTEEREREQTTVEVQTPVAERTEAPAVDAPLEEPERTARAAAANQSSPGNDLLQRLVRSVSHQLRNPLVPIRTFESLLEERLDDPEFRSSFRVTVGDGLNAIERVLDKLSGFAALKPAATAPVNVAALLEQLLEERRAQIQTRRLLVLKEIDTSLPFALCDEAQLRFALESLLDKAFEWVPERADLYLASKHHPSGLRGEPAVRVLIRFHNPAPVPDAESADAGEDLSLRSTSIEIVLAELVIGAQGGALTFDTTDAEETVILLDLPAPA